MTEIFWGARRLLEAQASSRPLVVVVDDIHSAEATFLDLLTHLVESPTPRPILVLCSARPEVSEIHADWWEATGSDRIELAPLGRRGRRVDHRPAPRPRQPDSRDAGRRVVTAAEGNPLYVEQLVSMLRDRPAGDATATSSYPPTIAALARVPASTPSSAPERAVIEPASVIGRAVPRRARSPSWCPSRSAPTVGTHLGTLRSKQLIHPTTCRARTTPTASITSWCGTRRTGAC